jgi:Bacterial PH domain
MTQRSERAAGGGQVHADPGAPAEVAARPRRATRVARILAVLVVVLFSAIATALHGATDSGKGVFQTSDQIAMIGLGVLGGLGILAFTRPRVRADRRGIRVRNVVGGYDLPWEVVRSVEFRRGSPWASLELRDDDTVPVMAVQAADKGYAVATVRALRALLAAHQAGPAAGPDPG